MNYPAIVFENWTISAPKDVIARQFDNASRALYVVGNLPDGYTWEMLISAQENLNIIRLERMDGGIGAVLTEEQLAIGNAAYTMQLRGKQGDVVRHTNKIFPFIPDSLSGNAKWPVIPSAFTDYEKRLNDLNNHPPQPGDNGFWMVWNPSEQAYEESAIPLPAGNSYHIGHGLKLDTPTNTLSVNTVNDFEGDNTLPITAAAVQEQVGNIEILLGTI